MLGLFEDLQEQSVGLQASKADLQVALFLPVSPCWHVMSGLCPMSLVWLLQGRSGVALIQ